MSQYLKIWKTDEGFGVKLVNTQTIKKTNPARLLLTSGETKKKCKKSKDYSELMTQL